MGLFNGLPAGYQKTDIATRYNQDQSKLGPVLSPILSQQWQGDDGQAHTIEIMFCTYGFLVSIDGDTYSQPDSASLNRFLA